MINVTYLFPFFYLSFPFNRTDLQTVRTLPVRDWDKNQKVWTVPELAVQTLDGIKNLHWDQGAQDKRDEIKHDILKLVDYKFASDGIEDEYLRPYQQIGVNFLVNAKKALLADDMGLGKSIQAIQTLLRLGTETNLILCPATLKFNWYNEFVKHFGIEPIVIGGSAKERLELWKGKHKFVIANYDILARDWNHLPRKWDAVVCDEIVYLKNPKSMRTKLAKRIQSDVRIGLSGMLLENNLMEFHSIFDWVRSGLLPSFYRFQIRYMDFGWDGKVTNYKNLEELHLLTSPYILRRKKSDVLKELPPKIHTDFPLEFDTASKKAYNAIVNEFWQWLKEQTGKTWNAAVLEKMIRMRQFVEFPETVGFHELQNVKLQWLRDIYKNVGKIVVFTYFRKSVELLQEEFQAKYILTGSTPAKDRVGIVDAFNAADEGMFILTDAGRFGINITGANNVVNFGYFYNPATILQREDRLHRIGQENTVNVLNPYIIGSIDEGIRKVFLKRSADAQDFMDGSEKMAIARLSKEDFRKMVIGEAKDDE